MVALATVLASATIWVQLLRRSDDLMIAPQATARAVLAELHDGVALVEFGGKIQSANPRLAAIMGCGPADLVGRSLSDLVDTPLELLQRGLEEREVRLNVAPGTRIPVSLSSACVQNRKGGTSWIVVVFRDLRNVDALRRQLLTSGRLAAVGELAAGIAHEVNNPVAFIRSDLNFLRSRLAEIEAEFSKTFEEGSGARFFSGGEARIDAALAGIARVAEVVADVREFVYVGSGGSASGDPTAIINSAIRLARLERREDVALKIVDVGGLPHVASGQDFKQVVLALLRVMTVGSKMGASVTVQLVADESVLRVDLNTDLLENPASEQIERFRRAEESLLEASAVDLGLAMAIELADQLGGDVSVDAPTEGSLHIGLAWPFEKDEVSE